MQKLHNQNVNFSESHTTWTTCQSKSTEEPQEDLAHDCPLPLKQEICPASPSSFTHSPCQVPDDEHTNVVTEIHRIWKNLLWRGRWYIKSASKSRSYHCHRHSLSAVAQLERDCLPRRLSRPLSPKRENVNILQFLSKCHMPHVEWKSSISFG